MPLFLNRVANMYGGTWEWVGEKEKKLLHNQYFGVLQHPEEKTLRK